MARARQGGIINLLPARPALGFILHGLIAAAHPSVELASVPNKARAAMGMFVGLDVSLKESVCVLDQDGTRVFEGTVASEPAAIVRLIRKRAPDVVRVGLESAVLSRRLNLPWNIPCHHISDNVLYRGRGAAAAFKLPWVMVQPGEVG